MTTAPDSAPVCLITGGSSGIGLATAARFLEQGYRVLICGRSAPRLQQAAEQLTSTGQVEASRLLTVSANLEDSDQALGLVQRAIQAWGRIDVLVNNAAVAPLAPIAEVTPEQLEATLQVNVRAPFELIQAVWPIMQQQASGTIINLSSMAAVDPFPGFALYGASKAWGELLTTALAAEGQPLGIRVCAVRPGAVETPLLRGLFPGFPAQQCVAPAEVADVIWGCVADPQQYPTGEAFPVVAPSSSDAT